MMYQNARTGVHLVVVAIIFVGCGELSRRTAAGAGQKDSAPASVVDSVFPIEEEIRRFKLGVAGEAVALAGGAPSREELVSNFVAALQQTDTAALGAMVIDRAEFIDLYFPHTCYTRSPYTMDPAIVWFQMLNHSSRGITRSLRRFGGIHVGYLSHACGAEPSIEGPNRVWERCVVRIAPEGDELELRLFGSIVEREGRFKFLTYGNDL